jgi:hypothetical protein
MKLRIDYCAHGSLELDSTLCYSSNISHGVAFLEVSDIECCTSHSSSDVRLVELNHGLDDELSVSLRRYKRRAKKKERKEFW